VISHAVSIFLICEIVATLQYKIGSLSVAHGTGKWILIPTIEKDTLVVPPCLYSQIELTPRWVYGLLDELWEETDITSE